MLIIEHEGAKIKNKEEVAKPPMRCESRIENPPSPSME